MLTQKRLKEVLDFNPDTGEFRWKALSNGRSRKKCKAGTLAGCIVSGGYLGIRVDGIRYSAHRLAYLFMEGVWPPEHIDHKDAYSTKTDNKWENLRPATNSQNGMNHRLASNNTSGVSGVYWYKRTQQWKVEICANNKRISLGYHDNFEDAVKARKEGEHKYFGEFRASS